MKIPGIYPNVPMSTYHNIDWTPEPALSSSGAVLLTEECPRLFHYQYLDPSCVEEPNRAFDVGNSVHLLALEPEEFSSRVAIIECDDYRTKDAREKRDAARAAGKIPLLTAEAQMVAAMRDAVMAHPVARHAFDGATPELSYVWRDADTGVLCKARPDIVPPHARYFTDLKTSTSANPRKFERQAAELSYFQRAAWYLDAKQAIDGERPQRFFFVVVSKKPPHLVTVCEASADALEWGRIQNRKAREIFADCLAAGRGPEAWPPYRRPDQPDRDAAFVIGLPGWRERELEKRHEAGAFSTRSDMRAVELAEAHDSTPFA